MFSIHKKKDPFIQPDRNEKGLSGSRSSHFTLQPEFKLARVTTFAAVHGFC